MEAAQILMKLGLASDLADEVAGNVSKTPLSITDPTVNLQLATVNRDQESYTLWYFAYICSVLNTSLKAIKKAAQRDCEGLIPEFRNCPNTGFTGLLGLWSNQTYHHISVCAESLLLKIEDEVQREMSAQQFEAYRTALEIRHDSSPHSSPASHRRDLRGLLLCLAQWQTVEDIIPEQLRSFFSPLQFPTLMETEDNYDKVMREFAVAVFMDKTDKAKQAFGRPIRKDGETIAHTEMFKMIISGLFIEDEGCRRAKVHLLRNAKFLQNPYFEAASKYLTDRNVASVLSNEAILITDRIGLAAWKLSDEDLDKFLHSAIRMKPHSAIYATGLTIHPAGVSVPDDEDSEDYIGVSHLQSYFLVNRAERLAHVAHISMYARLGHEATTEPHNIKLMELTLISDEKQRLAKYFDCEEYRLAVLALKKARQALDWSAEYSSLLQLRDRIAYHRKVVEHYRLPAELPRQRTQKGRVAVSPIHLPAYYGPFAFSITCWNCSVPLERKEGKAKEIQKCPKCGVDWQVCAATRTPLGNPQISYDNDPFPGSYVWSLNCGHAYNTRDYEKWCEHFRVCPSPGCNRLLREE